MRTSVAVLMLTAIPLTARAQSPPASRTESRRSRTRSDVAVAARPANDSASFVEGRYDYRRYLARPIVIRGLSAGFGVRGIGERRALRHHFADRVELTETDVASSIAAVASLRFRRVDRVAVDAEWTNGATLARSRQRHAAGEVAEIASWPEMIAYDASASFLAWLLDTYGADSLRRIYNAASGELAGRIASVYGRTLESLEADWLRFCETWAG